MDTKVRWTERFLDDTWSSQLVIGGQGFIAKDVVSGGQGITFPGPGLEITEAAASQVIDEFSEEKVNAGVFAQEQIGYNDVAFLTVGGRLDRNSAFGESEGAAFYPKVGLSVIPSDLASWTSSRISTLRLRGAMGKSGLQPGAFDRLGLGAAALREINPRLVHCALSGFGQTGPAALKAGHDINYMALAGGLATSGSSDRPVSAHPPTADNTITAETIHHLPLVNRAYVIISSTPQSATEPASADRASVRPARRRRFRAWPDPT